MGCTDFNYTTGEKNWWLLEVTRYELEARKRGLFDLACLLQNAASILSRTETTRLDFRRALVTRSSDNLQTLLHELESLDKLMRLEKHEHQPGRLLGSTSRACTDVE